MYRILIIALIISAFSPLASSKTPSSPIAGRNPVAIDPDCPAFGTTPEHFVTIVHVPRHYATIQSAIDAAMPGWLILVAPGVYLENIDFLGKAITLRSDDDGDWRTLDPVPETTVIDGGQNGAVVSFISEEKLYSRLEGFTLTNGSPEGVLCKFESTPIITGNRIIENTGNGITSYLDCIPVILDNLIADNTGNGIFTDFDDGSIISGNTISGNTKGIYLVMSPDNLVRGNGISGNTAGGIHFSNASGRIDHNVITNNTAGGGGGISFIQSNGDIINNLIADNTAHEGGGVLIAIYSKASFFYNTVVGNSADEGGGIACRDDSGNVYVENCILWDNDAPLGKEIWIDKEHCRLLVSYSVLDGGSSSVYVDPSSVFVWGSGMIEDDPLFVSGPQGDYYLSQVAAGQALDSPCLDGGNAHIDATDLVGYWTRTDEMPDSGQVDIGFHYGPDVP